MVTTQHITTPLRERNTARKISDFTLGESRDSGTVVRNKIMSVRYHIAILTVILAKITRFRILYHTGFISLTDTSRYRGRVDGRRPGRSLAQGSIIVPDSHEVKGRWFYSINSVNFTIWWLHVTPTPTALKAWSSHSTDHLFNLTIHPQSSPKSPTLYSVLIPNKYYCRITTIGSVTGHRHLKTELAMTFVPAGHSPLREKLYMRSLGNYVTYHNRGTKVVFIQ